MIATRRLRRVSSILGPVLKWFGAVFLVPLGIALYQGTPVLPFVVPLALAVGIGWGLEWWAYTDRDLAAEDGFLLVVLAWIGVSLFGSLPYLISGVGSIGAPMNAFFESVSGFTATGSTVMLDISVEKHGFAVMLWRQMTQWLGGMGILVLAVAVLPRLAAGGAQFLDAEVPGPRMERLTPHIAATARRLWLLYLGLSVLLFGLFMALAAGGVAPRMDVFQAISHVFTTIPSGGFSPQARSIEAFAPAVQWTIIPFMFVAAMSFALLWRTLFSSVKAPFRNTEFKVYLTLFAVGGVLVSTLLWFDGQFGGIEETIRQGFFQTATLLTTTGYASTDFAIWNEEILVVLFVLMLTSGCAGSTSGGLKVMRWVVSAKTIGRELFQMVHPSSVRPMRMGERVVKESVVRGIVIVIVAYLLLLFIGTMFVALDTYRAGLEFEVLEALTATLATLGNIGPGMGAVGPMGNFEMLPVPSKLVMCFLMIAGRLEVMAFLVVLTPRYWK